MSFLTVALVVPLSALVTLSVSVWFDGKVAAEICAMTIHVFFKRAEYKEASQLFRLFYMSTCSPFLRKSLVYL